MAPGFDRMEKSAEYSIGYFKSLFLDSKKNGIMVYSTCSLLPDENQKQIQSFLNKHSHFEVQKEIVIDPVEYEFDGFYACVLKKQNWDIE